MNSIADTSGEPTASMASSRASSITWGRIEKFSVSTCSPLTMSVTLMKLLKRSATNT